MILEPICLFVDFTATFNWAWEPFIAFGITTRSFLSRCGLFRLSLRFPHRFRSLLLGSESWIRPGLILHSRGRERE
jgi:hypothetical protein